jgi:hypothetical protein
MRARNVVIAVSPIAGRRSPGQLQPPPALDELPFGAGVDAPEPLEPAAAALNEVTVPVTSLPLGATSHHLAPKLSLPCPVAVPGPESPAK